MIGRVLGTAVTTLLVAIAVGLATWFAYSSASGATLIAFRTGSMTPTMPQGAIAVTVPVRAAELRVGDVVTVQRANEAMPVTHRIIEIRDVSEQPAGGFDVRAAAPGRTLPGRADPAAREIVMQGDANQVPDALPYVVADARRVVAAVPHLGSALMLLQSPISMGALVIGVGALVTWAFWPRRRTPDAGPLPDAGPAPGAAPDAAPSPAAGDRPRGRHAAGVGV